MTFKRENVEFFREKLDKKWSKKLEENYLCLEDENLGDIYQIRLSEISAYGSTRYLIAIVHQITDEEFLVLSAREKNTEVSNIKLQHVELRNGKTKEIFSYGFDYAGNIVDCTEAKELQVKIVNETILIIATDKKAILYYLDKHQTNETLFDVIRSCPENSTEYELVGVHQDPRGLCLGYYNPFTKELITPVYNKLRQRSLKLNGDKEQRLCAARDYKELKIAENDSNRQLSYQEKKAILLEKGHLEEAQELPLIKCPFYGKIELYPDETLSVRTTTNQLILTKRQAGVVELGGACKGVKQIGRKHLLALYFDNEQQADCLAIISTESYKFERICSHSELFFLTDRLFVDDKKFYYCEEQGYVSTYDCNRIACLQYGETIEFATIRHTELCRNSFRFVSLKGKQIGGIYIQEANRYVKTMEEGREYLEEVKQAEEIVNSPTAYDEIEPLRLEKMAYKAMREYRKLNHIPL